MADYTPTTEEVREYVATGGEPRPWDAPDDEKDAARGAAFDRWLMAHDREVRADERARIVARLNADIDDLASYTEDHPATSGILRAVGLITLVDRSEKKAEKKRARRTGRTYSEVRAEAWDEGHEAGTINAHEHRPGRRMTNPYREGDPT